MPLILIAGLIFVIFQFGGQLQMWMNNLVNPPKRLTGEKPVANDDLEY